MTASRIWLIGQMNDWELLAATRWLRAEANCTSFADCLAAVEAARQGRVQLTTGFDEPHLVAFCVTRPGQIDRAEVEAVHRATPLARLVALVGPWCEGEVRSGRPWPGVTRIYWHQWQPRLVEEVTGLARIGARRLPRTASVVDALLSRAGTTTRAARAASLGVIAQRHADFESLAQALASGGHHAWRLEPHDPLPDLRPDALVVDSTFDFAAALEELHAARSRLGATPALLLCNFPRPDEVREATDLPNCAIAAKPFLIADLLTTLAGLLPAPARQAGSTATAAA